MRPKNKTNDDDDDEDDCAKVNVARKRTRIELDQQIRLAAAIVSVLVVGYLSVSRAISRK